MLDEQTQQRPPLFGGAEAAARDVGEASEDEGDGAATADADDDEEEDEDEANETDTGKVRCCKGAEDEDDTDDDDEDEEEESDDDDDDENEELDVEGSERRAGRPTRPSGDSGRSSIWKRPVDTKRCSQSYESERKNNTWGENEITHQKAEHTCC